SVGQQTRDPLGLAVIRMIGLDACAAEEAHGGTHTAEAFGRDGELCHNTEHPPRFLDRKSTRLNSSHRTISYAVFCLKKKTLSTTGAKDRANCLVMSLVQRRRMPGTGAVAGDNTGRAGRDPGAGRLSGSAGGAAGRRA